MDRIQQLEERIAKLEQALPLSPSFMGALNQGFITTFFSKFNVKRLFLTTGSAINPSVEGEVVYHSTTPSVKVMLGGAVKTFTVT